MAGPNSAPRGVDDQLPSAGGPAQSLGSKRSGDEFRDSAKSRHLVGIDQSLLCFSSASNAEKRVVDDLGSVRSRFRVILAAKISDCLNKRPQKLLTHRR